MTTGLITITRILGCAFGAARMAILVAILLVSAPFRTARDALASVAAVVITILGLVPRFLRLLFVSTRIFFAVSPAVVMAAMAVFAITNPYMVAGLDYAHDRSAAAELLDRDGRWLGIVPPASFPDWSDGSFLPPDQAAIPLVDIPPVWRSCLVYLEDRDFDGVSRWLGFDPLAVLKSGWQTITLQRRRGASTLYMQVVRMLEGQTPGPNEAPGRVLLRKVSELLGANALVRILDDRDTQAAARFVGMHLPLVIGTGGSSFGEPLYGVELASRVLFGEPASALSPDRQAVLAAAVKAPVILAPPDDQSGLVLERERWQRVKQRADYCLQHVLADQPDELSAAREHLAALPPPAPTLPPDMARLLPDDPVQAWRVAVNPVRRALFFARYELGALGPELEQVAGSDWRGRVVSIKLTTSATENRIFADRILAELDRLQSTLPRLYLSLTPAATKQPAADVVVAYADAEGEVRGIYSSRQRLFWDRKAPVGSIAKMAAAIVLGRTSGPSALYCTAPMSDGSDAFRHGGCSPGTDWISASDAFAQSNSKAIQWALRGNTSSDVARVASILHLPSFGETPFATALTDGTFEMTPAEMLRLAATIGTGLTNPSRGGPTIRTIEEITLLGADGLPAVVAAPGERAVSTDGLQSLFTPRVGSFVRNVLSATSQPDGTLRSLGWLREQLDGNLFAKTGTVSVAGSTRDLHIAGAYFENGRPWSFIVTIGTPDSALPLGRRLEAGEVASLVARAVCGLDHPIPKAVVAN